MKEYTTKDIANIAGIATPTVRKYAQILESNGYNFMKNGNGNRIFFDSDISIFQEIKKRSSDTGMNVDNIVKNLISEQKKDTDETIQSESHVITLKQNDDTSQNESYKILLNEIQELKEMMKQQQVYIDHKLETRDQLLLESIRAMQGIKQAQIETAAAERKKDNRGFWARLFKK